MEWLRIGEVSKRTGLTHRTLRHYDELGLLVPSGRSGGDYRLYAEEDLVRLLAIQHLKSLGFTLGEVGQALDEPEFDAAALLVRHAELVEQRIAEEQELLARLRHLQHVARAGWQEVLDVIALSERLRHPEGWVRFRAALTQPESAPLADLIDLLASDPEPGVREVATWAITQQGPGVIPSLVAALEGGDQQSRHSLAHVLGKLRHGDGLGALARLLGDADEAVAAKAAFSIGQLKHPGGVRALIGALDDERVSVREAAAASLAELPEASDALVSALGGPSARTRAMAAEALGFRREVGAVGQLRAALADDDHEVRFAALLALSAIDTRESADAVEEATTSSDDRVRLLAERLVSDARRSD